MARRYATAPESTKKPANWGLYLSAAGATGLGYYAWLQMNDVKVAAKPIQDKSPLDPDNFKDFKLKKVVPYNHNTAK